MRQHCARGSFARTRREQPKCVKLSGGKSIRIVAAFAPWTMTSFESSPASIGRHAVLLADEMRTCGEVKVLHSTSTCAERGAGRIAQPDLKARSTGAMASVRAEVGLRMGGAVQLG
uniref:Uncharacterized protein n=1 Tax=Arundo donax TaxID=35708 RepID=A0A0A8XQT9_ARUDO